MSKLNFLLCLAAACVLVGCAQPGRVKMTSEQLDQRIRSQDNFVLLDVREEHEYQAAHIKGAVWMPLSQFDPSDTEAISKLTNGDPDIPLIVYCRTGNRSGYISSQLANMGDVRRRILPPATTTQRPPTH